MLNKAQQEAVQIIDKPLLVTAGPGTGKTKLITDKILHLIKKGFDSDAILALTFTDKAAEEMTQRVQQNYPNFTAKTFHSFALELLEDNVKLISSIASDFKLLDETSKQLFFLENLDSFNLKSLEIKNNRFHVASELNSSISLLKEHGITLELFAKEHFENITTKADILSAYIKYEQHKQKHNLLDFADLLMYTIQLLESNPKLFKTLKLSLQYIVVDEFQDTNQIQFELLTLISSHNNITVVGDKKQSIYGFRGAKQDNYIQFKQHFKGAQEIILDTNYRSSSTVLDVLNNITQKIASKEECLVANEAFSGQVKLTKAQTPLAQNQYLVETLKQELRLNSKTKIGVIARTKRELEELSTHLNEENISHSISLTLGSLLKNPQIQSLLHILEVIENPREANVSLFHLLKNYGLRNETIKTLSRKSSYNEQSLYKVLLLTEKLDYPLETALLVKLKSSLELLIKNKEARVSLKELITQTLYHFKFYEKALHIPNNRQFTLYSSFLTYVRHYDGTTLEPSLSHFLTFCKYATSYSLELEEEKENTVELLTYHQGKGKEFETVFLINLNERKFPLNYKTQLFPTPYHMEREEFLKEEEHLFFVGLSRAKKNLYLSYVHKNPLNKTPNKQSKFLESLSLKETSYEPISKKKLSSKDHIKKIIGERINNLLSSEEYELAQREIDLLKNLFKEKNLTSYFGSDAKHPDFKNYINQLKNEQTLSENLAFDHNSSIYSVSQLQTYANCPRKFLYSYVYKIPSLPKPYFDFGNSMHKVLEECNLEELNKLPEEIQLARLSQLLKEFWISKGYTSAKEEQEYFEKGVIALKNYLAKEKTLSKRTTLFKEKTFLISLGGKKLRGIIDRIDETKEGIELLDYKTSNSKETKAQLENNMQLYTYALALSDTSVLGKVPQTMGLWYLIHNDIVSIKFNKEKAQEIKEKILELINKIESENFTPTPSFFACTYCDFNSICDKSKHNSSK